ncbi:MAG TPA: helix-turn-helix domain-containing protein [Solirubrobacterales bacterium]|nr:helix-turn-helix domain-containing protein [Solirubrobacterales bacterium]
MDHTPWEPDYIDDELARAVGHPTRAQILAEANERVMSPSQFAKRHQLDVSQVAYHFRQLEKYDCLELVAEVPARGSTEHFYKATRRTLFDGKAWDNLPETIKNKISGRTVTDLLEAISEAMLEETFDEHSDRALAWDKVLLDEQGWKEIVAAFREAIFKTLKAASEAELRVADSGEQGMLASWAFLFFKSPFTEPDRDE